MKVFTHEGCRPIKAWIDHVPEVEQAALDQLKAVSSMPFIHRHVACMPDVHWGNGTAVGSVIATKGAIIPAAVGVDLGCGMMALRTSLTASQLPDNLAGLRSSIEAAVPHGRTANGGRGDKGAWDGRWPQRISIGWAQLKDEFEQLVAKHPKLDKCNTVGHLGTLGGGNHFIEVCLDEADRVWLMLHSGSRGVGNRIGSHFIELAKKDMQRWFINLPDQNLAYLVQGSDHFDDYCQAVRWAQSFAFMNRSMMMQATMDAVKEHIPVEFTTDEAAVNCHHNYVSWERHFGDNVIVTRKGAVSAKQDQLGIIPGAMGRKSYIVRGKGNLESFHSCSHGAGRVMSRTEAKKRFTLADHELATAGVECRKDAEVIDETPMAYKDIDSVMASQSDLVDIVHTLRAVLCVKG
jgi:tRNA-splicing ligase RtcB